MMMIEKTGGARLGITNGTIPFGYLCVTEEAATVGIRMIKEYTLERQDVIAVEPVMWFPLIAQGVRFRHSREDVPSIVIFWTLMPPSKLIREIQEVGFVATALESDEIKPTFPFRIGFAVAFVVLWNAAFLTAFHAAQNFSVPLERAVLPVVVLAAIVVAAVLFFPAAQRLALKDTVPLDRVAPVLRLVLLVLAFMATGMTWKVLWAS